MTPRPGYRPTVPQPSAVQPKSAAPGGFEAFAWEIVELLERTPDALTLLDMSVGLGEQYARYKEELRRRVALAPAVTPVEKALDALVEAPVAKAPEPVAEPAKTPIAPIVRRVGVMRPSVPTTVAAPAPAPSAAPVVVAPVPKPVTPAQPLSPAARAVMAARRQHIADLKSMEFSATDETDADDRDEDDLGDADAPYRSDAAAPEADDAEPDDGWADPFAGRPTSSAMETGPVRGLNVLPPAFDEADLPEWLGGPAGPPDGPYTGADQIPALIAARAKAKRLTS